MIDANALTPDEYSFTRYLAAKAPIDERSLNKDVWQRLAAELGGFWQLTGSPERPLEVLEAGAGIGTMAERLGRWHSSRPLAYTGIDRSAECIAEARRRVAAPPGVAIRFGAVELFDFARRQRRARAWDLLIAHAFLDLVDVSRTLPQLRALVRPGGLFYFTMVFDGATILEPAIDPGFDAQVEALYHRTMDERITGGQASGDSRAGRHLFGHLSEAGIELLAAGSSDWIVHPMCGRYPGDEAYFLHYIIHTVDRALAGRSELDAARFQQWIERRHAQIEAGELVYVAHQLDFLGQAPRG